MRRGYFRVIRRTLVEWHKDNSQRLAAAVAFYTLFSLAPLVLLCLAVAGHFYGARAARGELLGTLRELVGPDVAKATQVIIADAARSESKFSATLVGAVVLFIAASGVFSQLQSALNTIWHVPARNRGVIRHFFIARLLSVLMVFLVISFIMASLLVTAALSQIRKFEWLRYQGLTWFWQSANFVIFFALLTVLFALMFRFLASVQIAWRVVWVGSALTSFLFAVGQTVIGFYIGRTSLITTYGAAGSLVLILFWAYYTASVVLFGAEFTKVLAQEKHAFNRRFSKR